MTNNSLRLLLKIMHAYVDHRIHNWTTTPQCKISWARELMRSGIFKVEMYDR